MATDVLRFKVEVDVEQPITAQATVTITVTAGCPWWMCCKPDPVIPPCPDRPTEFVPLDQYDVNFSFPLTSSRTPKKLVREVECITCKPNHPLTK